MVGSTRGGTRRAMLYQLCRAGARFEVGDGAIPLGNRGPVVLGRGDGSTSDPGGGFVYTEDPWMSVRHAQVTPLERKGTDSSRGLEKGSPSRWVVEDLGSTNGVLVNGVPSKRAPLLHGDLIETGRTFWLYVEEPSVDPQLTEPVELGGIATWTPLYGRQLAELLPRVPTGDHVLVTGAAGSGKGFLARTIHVVSGRAGRFVHLDCSGRRLHRLAALLFGDDVQPGRLRDADSGTLFLENVDALPLEVQDRLLEAVRRRGYFPEGRARTRSIALSARIVAATALSIEDAVATNRLRQGLVDVLGAAMVRIPALEHRMPDLGLLIDDFLSRARGAPAISRDACRAILRYPFKLNARALGHAVEAAAVLAAAHDDKAPGGVGGQIEVIHLPVDVVGPDMLKRIVTGGPQSVPENTSEMTPVPGSRPSRQGGSSFEQEPTDPESAKQAAAPVPGWRAPPQTAASAFTQKQPPAEAGSGEGGASSLEPADIVAALAAAHGNVSAAARALGRPRAQLLRLMGEFGIER
ncbi:MAG: sigma 54-interacting transcriptional regulator [Deltaproteobacteria bacterium]|nr:sigma 54-interacting transcriptional regulator [Deltaproteobacteria bacterium]